MRIIKTDKDYGPKELYRFTLDPNIKTLKEMKGKGPMTVTGAVLYEDVDKTSGEVKTILAIATDKGVFGTNSPTAREDFEALAAIYDAAIPGDPIEVLSGTSKSGREFITIRLAD